MGESSGELRVDIVPVPDHSSLIMMVLGAVLLILGLIFFFVPFDWATVMMIVGLLAGAFLLFIGFVTLSFSPNPSELTIAQEGLSGRADSIYKKFWSYPSKRFFLPYAEIADIQVSRKRKTATLTLIDKRGRHYEFASVNDIEDVVSSIDRYRG